MDLGAHPLPGSRASEATPSRHSAGCLALLLGALEPDHAGRGTHLVTGMELLPSPEPFPPCLPPMCPLGQDWMACETCAGSWFKCCLGRCSGEAPSQTLQAPPGLSRPVQASPVPSRPLQAPPEPPVTSRPLQAPPVPSSPLQVPPIPSRPLQAPRGLGQHGMQGMTSCLRSLLLLSFQPLLVTMPRRVSWGARPHPISEATPTTRSWAMCPPDPRPCWDGSPSSCVRLPALLPAVPGLR